MWISQIDQLFLKYSDQPVWHQQSCHLKSHLNPLSFLFWCLVWTSDSKYSLYLQCWRCYQIMGSSSNAAGNQSIVSIFSIWPENQPNNCHTAHWNSFRGQTFQSELASEHRRSFVSFKVCQKSGQKKADSWNKLLFWLLDKDNKNN